MAAVSDPLVTPDLRTVDAGPAGRAEPRYRLTDAGAVEIPKHAGVLGAETPEKWIAVDSIGDGYTPDDHDLIVERLRERGQQEGV